MPYHLVYSLHNVEHLCIADLPIPINIIQLESPVELVLHLAPRRDAEGAYELLEIYLSGLVAVKDVEDVIRKRRRVAKGEELLVDLLELLLGELATGTILQEACRMTFSW